MLSRLLDEALDLPPQARAAWLAQQDAIVAPQLRRMLAALDAGLPDDLLAEPPMLTSAAAADAPDVHFQAGQVIGPYRLLEELGRGGMGVVWLAERCDGQLKRQVALKLPHLSVSRRSLLLRFERERDILAGLTHPHIARLYDAGLDVGFGTDSQPYLAMECVHGLPITAYCDQHALTLPQRLHLFHQVLDAVQYAHANLVIHRDIKPANILVDAAGEVRLLDFGISKLLTPPDSEPGTDATGLTQVAGSALTPDYASPEQFLQQPVGIASDVYSLGILLYELLSGAKPYTAPSPSRSQLEAAALAEHRPPPSTRVTATAAQARQLTSGALARRLRNDLDTVVLKAIKLEPAARYATVNALAEDLLRAERGEPILARPDSLGYRTRKFIARHRLGVAVSAAVALSLAVGLGSALWQARLARAEAQSALATEAFLQDLFGTLTVNQADPVRAQETPASELLARGSARIAQATQMAPQARLRILDTLIRLNEDLSLTEPAYALQQQKLALLRQLHPQGDATLAASLIAAANAAFSTSSSGDDAPGHLAQARALLDQLGNRDPVLRGRLEIAVAGQMDGDNCGAAEHSKAGVALLRRVPPGKDLLLGLRILTTNLAHCGDANAALAAGQEALALMKHLGDTASAWEVLATISQAQARLGQTVASIRTARQALTTAQALHPAGATPQGDELNAAGGLGTRLLGYGHPSEALDELQPLIARANRDIKHTDADGLVSLLRLEMTAWRWLGYSQRALHADAQIEALLKNFQADDSQRVLVFNARAGALMADGQWPQARKALDEAAALHTRLHHTGSSQMNEHQALLVSQFLGTGQVDAAAHALAAFIVKPTANGASTRPQIEHAVLSADIALVAKDWPAAQRSAELAQALVLKYPEPVSVEDLRLRAVVNLGLVALAQGQPAAAQRLLPQAIKGMEAQYGPADSPIYAPVWAALARSASSPGQAQEFAAKAKRAAEQNRL